jgi:hypothetical protein
MQFVVSFMLVLSQAANVALGASGGSLRFGHLGSQLVKGLEFKHRLRVCNAYPYAAPLDVLRGKEKLTANAMPYKSCVDFKTQLKAGDKLAFKVGDANAGVFSVSDLPNNDAVLLLVIYRHDTLSTAVSFESHVFANLLNAQVAVIDTYKGSAKSSLKIMDDEQAKTARAESLRYDSVVALNSGKYQCLLEGTDGKVSQEGLVALNRESYVILRVGVEAQAGQSYPQEIVVYPKSDPAMLHGAASGVHVSLLAVVIALAFALGN